jgi:hypothetical protein
MVPALPDDLWQVVAGFLPVRAGYLASRACKPLRLALLKHRCEVVCIPYNRAPVVAMLVSRLKSSDSPWPEEPMRRHLMRLGKTYHIGEAYKMKLTGELFELLVDDCLRVTGWAGMRKHLDRPFYSGRIRIPEGGVFISLAEQNRLAEMERQRKRNDWRCQLACMVKYSEYESDTEYESD